MIPPRSILAAVDFSDSSSVALAFAARLARQCGAALHVLHAEDPLLSAAAHHRGIDLSSETREALQALVDGAPPAANAQPHLHVLAGRPVDVICDFSDRLQSDVIVVGSHGMSGPSKLVFGSTTEAVLRYADRSIFVVPDVWRPPQPATQDLQGTGPLLAAVDFSEESRAATVAARDLARVLGTSVEIVHVVAARPAPARWQAYAEDVVSDKLEDARRSLATVAEALGADVPVRTRVETGSVPQALADITAPSPWRQPVLVLGRRPPGERGSAPGAIAYRVLSLTNVPVLVHVSLADGQAHP